MADSVYTCCLLMQKEILQWQLQLKEVKAQLDRVHVIHQQEEVAEEMLQQLRASCILKQSQQLSMPPNSLLSGGASCKRNVQLLQLLAAVCHDSAAAHTYKLCSHGQQSLKSAATRECTSTHIPLYDIREAAWILTH